MNWKLHWKPKIKNDYVYSQFTLLISALAILKKIIYFSIKDILQNVSLPY